MLRNLVVAVLALVLGIFLLQLVASESAEVVVLTSQGDGGEQETRLWVVDLEGVPYLRAQPGSGWYQRLRSEPQAALTRNGTLTRCRAEPRLEQSAEVNRLMREKYGWRDAYISWMFGGREDAIAIAMIAEG